MPHNLFLHSALVHSRPIEGDSDSSCVRRSPAAKRVCLWAGVPTWVWGCAVWVAGVVLACRHKGARCACA